MELIIIIIIFNIRHDPHIRHLIYYLIKFNFMSIVLLLCVDWIDGLHKI